MMKPNDHFMHRCEKTSREFISVNSDRQQDPQPGGYKPAETSFATSGAIRQRFPELKIGKAFLEHALERIANAPQFSSMVIRMDHHAQEENSTADMDHLQSGMPKLAQILDTLCAAENAFWGQLETDTFGSFFPGKSGNGGRTLSAKIKAALAQNRLGTISIGIASYPALNFSRRRILTNAAKALDHASFLGPDSMVMFDAVSLNISGDKHYQRGEIEKARRDFEMALKIDPTHVNIHNSLGVCHGVTGALEKALGAFETAIWLDPGEVMAFHNAGIIYQMKEMPEKAIEFFQKAAALDSNVFEVAFHTGKLLVEMSRPEEGKSYLEKAIQLKPASGIAWRCLGDCYSKIDIKKKKAVYAYKNAIKQNPEDAAALSALGFLYHLNGRNAEIADVFCRQSTLLEPENGLFRKRLGEIYLGQDRISEALSEFRKAHALGPDCMDRITQIEKQLMRKAS